MLSSWFTSQVMEIGSTGLIFFYHCRDERQAETIRPRL